MCSVANNLVGMETKEFSCPSWWSTSLEWGPWWSQPDLFLQGRVQDKVVGFVGVKIVVPGQGVKKSGWFLNPSSPLPGTVGPQGEKVA